MIELTNAGKIYCLDKVRVPALQNVNLNIDAAEFVALAGPSGSGKSTLLHLIGCMDKPSSGRIVFDGVDITNVSLADLADTRRQKIGFVFQTFNLLPVLTAFENVEYPLLMSGLSKAAIRERAMMWLESVGLAEQAGRRPDQLSGGQRQRVAIARAMVTYPRVIIADEPTANLDSVTGEEIFQLLTRINSETGTTLVIATHDPRIFERARRRVLLNDGAISGDNSYDAKSSRELATC
jgi:putative ABC transport system ATP-binding protein